MIRGVALSIATDRAGGFADDDIAFFDRLVPALGLAACRVSAARTAADALGVYLGPRTAERVLAGEIRRGEGERIAAAIFLADLKRFTSFSEREDSRGSFIGSTSTWRRSATRSPREGARSSSSWATACSRSSPWPTPTGGRARSARRLCARRRRWSRPTARSTNGGRGGAEPTLDVDVALHFGEAVYGNVGASRRLDFTVIGRAVNEISRMEMLCDRIGRSVVLSEAFARRCSRPTVALGAFPLRGIEGDRVVYALQ